MKLKAVIVVIAFVSTIVLANWLTANYGLIPVGFGLLATAGTYAAGMSFVVRDLVHEYGGATVAVAAIVLGALMSWVLSSPQLAIASGVTFLVAELLDLAVYVPLRERGLVRAAVASNVIGFTADTFLFLYLAGFAITGPVIAGQLLAKVCMTALGVAVLVAWRHHPVVGVE